MEKKVRSKEELLNEKSAILEEYNKEHSKSQRSQLLTKKEKKVLGIGKDQGIASLRYARISSRKVMIVLNLIKDKNIDEAYAIVKYTPKAASEILFKLMKSAESNAVNNNSLNRDILYVADAFANQGPSLKRTVARARGSAARILKRTSHITILLKEKKLKEKAL